MLFWKMRPYGNRFKYTFKCLSCGTFLVYIPEPGQSFDIGGCSK